MTPVVWLFALAMAVVAVAVGVAAVQRLAGDGPSVAPPTTAAVATTVDEAFAPLVREAGRLPDRARAWLGGERSDEAFGTDVEAAVDAFEETVDRVGRLDGVRHEAHELYEAAAMLYVQHALIYRGAIDGDLREQADLTARRVRLLADRTFDRARTADGKQLGVDDPNVVVNLPEEVPDWEAEGLAPGPPLDDPPTEQPRPALRQRDRPTQPRADWIAAVEAAGAPPDEQLAAAIESRDHGALQETARAYVEAAERLRQTPDPEGDREGATRVRLALLVASEAARAGQLGEPSVAGRLAEIARLLRG